MPDVINPRLAFVAVGLLLAGCASDTTMQTKTLAIDPQAVTPCDEVAAHPSDPRKVSPGHSTADIDLPKAVAICREAVSEQPDNPRLNYQLGRVLTYSKQMDAALPYLSKAADADYVQAVFVVGYLFAKGEMVSQDLCKAADLYYRAAKMGRQAALVAYPSHALRGDFDGCSTPIDAGEMRAFLKQADEATSNYYQGLLIESLTDKLEAS